MTARTDQRMLWILRRSAMYGHGFLVAWDLPTQRAFLESFPEAVRTTVFYTLGPWVVPMMDRAARRARDRGYFIPGATGNSDARSFNQRTWARTWRLTTAGKSFLASLGNEKKSTS